MFTPKDLHDYQVEAYKDILRSKTICITDDCGKGKTAIILTAFKVLLRKRPDSKMLAVCTPKGTKGTWSKEYLKWSHLKGLKCVTLSTLKPKERKEVLDKNEHDVYAISYGMLKWLVENNKSVDFNFVAADEADCLKGPSSKWRDFLIKAAPHAKYKILASATPKTREEDDYWGLCKYLDDGASLFSETVGEFRDQYCKSYNHNNRTIYNIGNKRKIALVEKRIAHLFRRYAPPDDDDIIPIKTITVNASLSDEAQDKYDKLVKEQCVNSIIYDEEGYRDNDESLDQMTLSGKLTQLARGFLYVDENCRITKEMLESNTSISKLIELSSERVAVDVFDDTIVKFGKLIDLIHQRHDSPIAIPYYYTHELKQLQGLLPTGVSDKEDDIEERWNDDTIDYLFMQYQRSSKSLNLQGGKGHVMAFYSPTWNWADDYQIVKRLARQGQSAKMVYAYRMIIKDTIDKVKTRKLGERFIGHTRFQESLIQTL